MTALLFSGGEPLSRPDLLHPSPHGVHFNLLSNGTLVHQPFSPSIAAAATRRYHYA